MMIMILSYARACLPACLPAWLLDFLHIASASLLLRKLQHLPNVLAVCVCVRGLARLIFKILPKPEEGILTTFSLFLIKLPSSPSSGTRKTNLFEL
jgi:hypothetical protein